MEIKETLVIVVNVAPRFVSMHGPKKNLYEYGFGHGLRLFDPTLLFRTTFLITRL